MDVRRPVPGIRSLLVCVVAGIWFLHEAYVTRDVPAWAPPRPLACSELRDADVVPGTWVELQDAFPLGRCGGDQARGALVPMVPRNGVDHRAHLEWVRRCAELAEQARPPARSVGLRLVLPPPAPAGSGSTVVPEPPPRPVPANIAVILSTSAASLDLSSYTGRVVGRYAPAQDRARDPVLREFPGTDLSQAIAIEHGTPPSEPPLGGWSPAWIGALFLLLPVSVVVLLMRRTPIVRPTRAPSEGADSSASNPEADVTERGREERRAARATPVRKPHAGRGSARTRASDDDR